MYNHEQFSDCWNKKWKTDWNNEKNDLLWSGNPSSRIDFNNGQSFVICNNFTNNTTFEYPCQEKSSYFGEIYGGEYGFSGHGNNYPTIYQSCSEEEWLANCNNCSSQYSYALSNYHHGHRHNPHHQQQNYSHQHRNDYWSNFQNMPISGPVMHSNYQQNMTAGMSTLATTAVVADPLNALQNLTVSAGQSAQIVAQQQRLSSTTAYNNQMRQRSLVQGSINRPIDSLSATKSPLSQQLVPSQIASNVVMSNPNVSNTNAIRMPGNTIAMKPEMCINQNTGQQSLMLPPYPMDSCNTLINNSQPISISAPGKIAQYNASMGSQFQPSKEQFSLNSQQPNNHFQTGTTVKRTLPPASNARTQNVISEEEAKKVKEEVRRLKERYFKKLTLILENSKNGSDEEMRVWTVLKNLLENPNSIGRSLSMRNIQKIEQHLLKAEQRLNHKNSNQVSNTHVDKPTVNTSQSIAQIQSSSSSRTNISKSVTNFDDPLKKSLYSLSNNSNDNMDINNGSINSSSLDIAFDDVCHQLTNTEDKVVKIVQKNLIEYVKSRQTQYRHFLPKRVFIDMDDEAISEEIKLKLPKMESFSTDEEFNILKEIDLEDLNISLYKNSDEITDENKLLRMDLDIAYVDMSVCNLDEELKVLESEFIITKLDDQKMSKDWFSYETEWNDSQFFSFSYKNRNLPSSVPPILVRIPTDYLDSGYTDWNLNVDAYTKNVDDFLSEVIKILTINFTETHHNYQWSGIPLLYILSLYKRSIALAYSNHIIRVRVEK